MTDGIASPQVGRLEELTDREIVRLIETAMAGPVVIGPVGSLPYSSLRDHGLERLGYRLLVAEGLVPRLFGKPGQRQYGIDLLAKDGDSYLVCQCKNVSHLARHEMRSLLELFEEQWLRRADEGWPRPTRFIVCCPLDLRELRQGTAWLELEEAFSSRTGIRLIFWDRTYLDERLRLLPDIVADLFTPAIAESFCEIDDWQQDLFEPVSASATSQTITHYLGLSEAGQLVLTPELQDAFTASLETIGAVLVRGSAGSGKSITSVALAAGLETVHRVYYTDLRYDAREAELVAGIRRRRSQQSVFVIDNCEHKTALALRLLERLRKLADARSHQPKLVLICHSEGRSSDLATGGSDLEDYLEEVDAVIDLEVTVDTIRDIIEIRKPAFTGLSPLRLERLLHLSAGDLVLVDWLLTNLNEPAEIDSLAIEDVLEQVIRRYFYDGTLMPCNQRVAALMQFDLSPEALTFPCNPVAEVLRRQFIAVSGRPPRYRAAHASMAELVFHAVCRVFGQTQPRAVAVKCLLEYFQGLTPFSPAFIESMAIVVGHRLRLISQTEEAALKAEFLSNPAIVEAAAGSIDQLSLVQLGLSLVFLFEGQGTALATYETLVKQYFAERRWTSRASARGREVHRFVRITRRRFPWVVTSLQDEILTNGIGEMVAHGGDYVSIVTMLAELVDERPEWLRAIERCTHEQIEDIVVQTCRSHESLDWSMGALGRLRARNEECCRSFESLFTPAQLITILLARGTLSTLFLMIGYSTRVDVLTDALAESHLSGLLQRTVDTGSTLAVLPNCLSRLGACHPDRASQLHQRIGSAGYASFIKVAGTITELIGICAGLPHEVAAGVIGQFEAGDIDAVVTRTARDSRSIGTIALRFRQLRDRDPSLAAELEQLLTARRYVFLIVEVGTIADLFRVFASASPQMASDVIAALEPSTTARIVARTIAADRPIGTLHMGLSRLRDLDGGTGELRAALESVLGVQGYRELISQQGTIGDLLMICGASSPEHARQVVTALAESDFDAIVSRTAERQRGFGTLALGWRNLSATAPDLAVRVEEKVSAARYVGLLTAIGTLPNLTAVLGVVSETFSREVLGHLDDHAIEVVIDRTIRAEASVGAIPLNLWSLEKRSVELAHLLEARIGASTWLRLLESHGSFPDLMAMLQHMSPEMAGSVIAGCDDSLLDELCRRTLAERRLIGSLPLWLRGIGARSVPNLVSLQAKIGAARLSKLIMARGDMQVLTGCMRHVTAEFRSTLWVEIEGRRTRIHDLVHRSKFVTIGRAARWMPKVLERLAQLTPEGTLAEPLRDCVARSTWEDVHAGITEFEQAHTSGLKGGVLIAVRNRLDAAGVNDLPSGRFSADAARLGLLWRLAPERREDWVGKLPELLPNPHDWPKEEGFLRWWAEILRMATHSFVDLSYVSAVTGLINDPRVTGLLLTASGRQAFYVAWQLFVLARTRKAVTIENVLPQSLVEKWLVAAEERFPQTNDLSVRDGWLALLGVLDVAGSLPARWKANRLKGLINDASVTARRAMESSPEVAVCSLLGWERALGQHIDAATWQRLSLKAWILPKGDADAVQLASIASSCLRRRST